MSIRSFFYLIILHFKCLNDKLTDLFHAPNITTAHPARGMESQSRLDTSHGAPPQEYAADDALVGALLFRALLEPKVPELTRDTWPRVLSACQGLVDCKYKPSQAVRIDEESKTG